EALKRMREKGYRIANLDCVVVADQPKISHYKKAIKNELSKLLGITLESISIKGKTREGFCKEEGLACFCILLLTHEG
ncbi:MAG: 2-C-methyl-D-erythritol 2,4-cyclodiphosphate synthase, partial [Aquificaceae bacterium]|nr:2-C-methyl-D-erythritol 2,4-cyclodiphosphate synthase [Aquificaceae bacterium]